MKRTLLLFSFALILSGLGTSGVHAQEWNPPSLEMPRMPRVADLRGDWMPSVQPWFRGVEAVSGVPAARLQANGEARPGSEYAQYVRFSSGPFPVVAWTDRNGDDRLDLLEIFRSGSLIIQFIDADYDGQANVIRVLDASGNLLRETKL